MAKDNDADQSPLTATQLPKVLSAQTPPEAVTGPPVVAKSLLRTVVAKSAPGSTARPTKISVAELITDPTPEVEEAEPENITVAPIVLDTPQTDAAIDDIVAQEADEVLAAEDADLAALQADAEAEFGAPAKHGHPIFWFFIVLLVIIAVIAAVVLTNPNLSLPFSP